MRNLQRFVWDLKAGLLSAADTAKRLVANYRRMADGVNLLDPFTVWIDPNVVIAPGATIEGNVHILGRSTIGHDTLITSGSRIVDSTIGEKCVVYSSVIEEGSVLVRDVQVGPFARIRGGSKLACGVRVGNYAEVSRSTLQTGVKMKHFSFVGDAKIGSHANIAAGVITANYDGTKKHQTVIGARAFVGCGATLVAPVKVGKNATIGAGAVVLRDKGKTSSDKPDIPDGKTAVGLPARVLTTKTSAN